MMTDSRYRETLNSRREIGFPADRNLWRESPAEFDNTAGLLKILGHPVMERWEEPYMRSLARIATSRGGSVLEVGFGLGLSAAFIQQGVITKHVIIEANRDVYQNALRFARTARLETIVYEGFWQDVVAHLADESFDGILFDTYPMTLDEVHCQHYWFFKQACRLLKEGGVFTYYSDEAESFSSAHRQALHEAGFQDESIAFEICRVDPPTDCEYWKAKTFLAPIITKVQF